MLDFFLLNLTNLLVFLLALPLIGTFFIESLNISFLKNPVLNSSKTTSTNTSTVNLNFNRNIPTTYTATKIPLSINNHSNNDIQVAIDGSVSGTIYYVFNGMEHIVIPGTLFFRAPLTPIVHLIKKNNIWQLENYYPEAAMGAGRNYEKIRKAKVTDGR